MQARYGIIARQKATSVRNFAKSAILLFLALRVGDVVNLAAGMWFVPKYVSPEEIGAVLPLTSFATFLSLPVFAFAMTVMKESAVLHAAGERAKVKSLLSGVFAAVGMALVLVLVASCVAVPHFLKQMRVSDASAGILVVSAAFLGCVAPVYTDALQSMKRFKSLAAVEVCGSAVRFLAMLATMPFRALAGYFAGQAALPAFRIAGSVIALRRDLSVPAEPYWNRETVRRVALAFLAVCAYQVAPMAAALVEQTTLRTGLSAADSAGYYMISRFSDHGRRRAKVGFDEPVCAEVHGGDACRGCVHVRSVLFLREGAPVADAARRRIRRLREIHAVARADGGADDMPGVPHERGGVGGALRLSPVARAAARRLRRGA